MPTACFAHIVFDLPLEGPFDYAVPSELLGEIAVGKRVEVPFANGSSVGYVTDVAKTSAIKNLKMIRAVLDGSAIVNAPLLTLAHHIASTYGCSLGQALGLMVPRLLRQGRRTEQKWKNGTLSKVAGRGVVLVHDPAGKKQFDVLLEHIQLTLAQGKSVLILVPDLFAMARLRTWLRSAFDAALILFNQSKTPKEELELWTKIRNGEIKIVVGTRSSIFAPLPDLGLMVVTDEGNPSYREEQTPFYETRDVVLARAQYEGAAVLLVSISPSVEAQHAHGPAMVEETVLQAQIKVVDLSNYKYIEKGMISIPLRGRLEEGLKIKALSVLVLNRRGLYAVTRCVECNLILRCPRCSSAVTFSRTAKQFVCPHCPSTLPADTQCPHCHKPSWKSFGMGVEKLQSELKLMFPQARIGSFERGDADLPSVDILIATQAVLRFKDHLKPQTTALVDFDGELNRLDMRSSYRAWRLAVQLRAMTQKELIVQTRNSAHHVVKALALDKAALFYDEEMRLRKELGFSPFAHWATVTGRGKQEKAVFNFIQDLYNILKGTPVAGVQIFSPEPGVPAKMRDQYRFRIMVQGPQAHGLVALVKSGLAKLKRPSRLIVTIEVDP